MTRPRKSPVSLPPGEGVEEQAPTTIDDRKDHAPATVADIRRLEGLIQALMQAVDTIGQQQQWVTEQAATAQEQLQGLMNNGGGLGGMLKMAKQILSAKPGRPMIGMTNEIEGTATHE